VRSDSPFPTKAFGDLKNPATGESNGAYFLLFLQERKPSCFGPEVSDRCNLGDPFDTRNCLQATTLNFDRFEAGIAADAIRFAGTLRGELRRAKTGVPPLQTTHRETRRTLPRQGRNGVSILENSRGLRRGWPRLCEQSLPRGFHQCAVADKTNPFR
jgi:hypothetical protein